VIAVIYCRFVSWTVVCVQLKAQFPDAFKAPELAVPPKHTLAALGGAAQHKELLDRCGSVLRVVVRPELQQLCVWGGGLCVDPVTAIRGCKGMRVRGRKGMQVRGLASRG
jgi:hypothetical protein